MQLKKVRKRSFFLCLNFIIKIHLVSQVVEVLRVPQWLFVSPMTPGAVIHPLAPD